MMKMLMKWNLALGMCVLAISSAWSDDLHSAMEAENVRWLSAFNSQNAAALPAMYTTDALLIPPAAPIAYGGEAIEKFWETRIKGGVRDHTFEMLKLYSDGKYAYQVAKWTAVLVKEGGEKTPLSGNNLRVFEHQNDGSWKIKAHIFVRD